MSLIIEGFGCLADVKITFAPHMTLLVGANEAGKSTVLACLRALFYGLGRRHADLERDLRRRYRPWSERPMGGVVVFENKGHVYRLERRFGATKRDDVTALYRDDRHTPDALAHPDAPGLDMFGLEEEAFINTVFAGQRALAVEAVAPLVNRLFAAAGDPATAHEVRMRLVRAKQALMGTRGRHGTLLQSYEEAVADLERSRRDEETRLSYVARLDDIDARLAALAAQMEARDQAATLYDDLCCLRAAQALADLDRVSSDDTERALSDVIVTDQGREITIHTLNVLSERHRALVMATERIRHKRLWLDARRETMARLADDHADVTAAYEQADAEWRRICAALAQPAPPRAKPSYIISGLLALLAVALILTLIVIAQSGVWRVVLGLLAALMMGVSILYGRHTHKTAACAARMRSRRIARLEAAQVEALATRTRLADIKRRMALRLSDAQRQYDEGEAMLKTMIDETSHDEADVVNAFSPYCAVSSACGLGRALEALRSQLVTPAEVRRQEQRRVLMGGDDDAVFAARVAESQARLTAQGLTPDDYEAALEHVMTTRRASDDDACARERDALERSRREVFDALVALDGEALDPDEQARNVKRLSHALAEVEQAGDALDVALTWLDGALADLNTHLAPRLNEAASRYLHAMTAGAYARLRVDRSLAAAVEDDLGRVRDQAYLSGATVDVIDVALRLALSDVISEDTGTMPLLLDESLAELDPKRLKATVKTLMATAVKDGRQIVYATSDPRLMSWFGDQVAVQRLFVQDDEKRAVDGGDVLH